MIKLTVTEYSNIIGTTKNNVYHHIKSGKVAYDGKSVLVEYKSIIETLKLPLSIKEKLVAHSISVKHDISLNDYLNTLSLNSNQKDHIVRKVRRGYSNDTRFTLVKGSSKQSKIYTNSEYDFSDIFSIKSV